MHSLVDSWNVPFSIFINYDSRLLTLVRILTPNCEGGGGLDGFTLMVLSLEHINYEESVRMKMDCRQEAYIVCYVEIGVYNWLRPSSPKAIKCVQMVAA